MKYYPVNQYHSSIGKTQFNVKHAKRTVNTNVFKNKILCDCDSEFICVFLAKTSAIT